MLAIPPETIVRFKCLRDGQELSVDIMMKAKPRPDGKALALRFFGLTVKPLTPLLARELRLAVSHGLLVVGIEAGSSADRLGIKLKDVLFQVGRLYVFDLESLGMTLEDVKPGQRVKIGIVRGNVRARATITAAGE